MMINQLTLMVLIRGGRLPRGASIGFKGGASPYALCDMESLINKLTKKYFCLCNSFIVRRTSNKGQLLKGGLVEKRLRSNGL